MYTCASEGRWKIRFFDAHIRHIFWGIISCTSVKWVEPIDRFTSRQQLEQLEAQICPDSSLLFLLTAALAAADHLKAMHSSKLSCFASEKRRVDLVSPDVYYSYFFCARAILAILAISDSSRIKHQSELSNIWFNQNKSAPIRISQHQSASISINQHTSVYNRNNQDKSASIRINLKQENRRHLFFPWKYTNTVAKIKHYLHIWSNIQMTTS